MILNVHHSTKYSYLEPVHKSIQIIRLTPFNNHRQKVITWALNIPGHANKNIDWFGNITHCVNIPSMSTEIEIIATGKVDVSHAMPNPELGTLPALYYLRETPLTELNPDMKILALSVASNKDKGLMAGSLQEILLALSELSALILKYVAYSSGVTNSKTSAIDAFKLGKGVCQDHAHIFLACSRFLGVPSRYVSGYLHTDDTSHLASHAWAEAWINNAWHSFDISNQCSADEKHIELAYGLDYLDASPIRGSRIGGGEERLFVLSLVTDQ
ncbi:MAG: transglutaminase [Burkholderiales bacterium]|jgi:transglutaminase-like putative cysteine protease|nr:transglutaminase [Burkholderiales bacterium]